MEFFLAQFSLSFIGVDLDEYLAAPLIESVAAPGPVSRILQKPRFTGFACIYNSAGYVDINGAYGGVAYF